MLIIIRQLATLFNANASGFLNSVYMQIGVIMIIGLAAKNAIPSANYKLRTTNYKVKGA